MDVPALEVAQDSFRRCSGDEGFFATFYSRLLGSSAAIPPLFANTNLSHQRKMLRHGVGLLLIYAKLRNPALLARIAARHSRAGVGVEPSLYPLFVDGLIGAVQAHDPQCGEAGEHAWREAVAPGIAFMRSRYE